MASILALRHRDRRGLMSNQLDTYLNALRRELHCRGLVGSRIVEEGRGHVLDAAEAEERQGIPPEAALDHVLERFGPARVLAVEFATERSLILQKILFAAGLGLGLLIGYVDSRPSWDDTGITAGVLLITTATLGALAPQRPWVWALCVGVWIPVFGISNSSNYGSLMAVAIAFVGAYGGMLVRRVFIPA
jgi:hypothetical protein